MTSLQTRTALLEAQRLREQGRADDLTQRLLAEQAADDARWDQWHAATVLMYQRLLAGAAVVIVVLLGAVVALAGATYSASVSIDGVEVKAGE